VSYSGNPMTLTAFLAKFDRSSLQSDIEKAEQQRAEILKRFPREAWPTMPLERYALGQADSSDTYCYWMEYKALDLGSMRGGSALKHAVFKHRDKPGWYYDASRYSNENEAWEAIRAAFVQAFDLAAAGDFDAIDELQAITPYRTLRVKTLHLYFPNDILPVNSYDDLLHFLKRLEAYEPQMRRWEVVRLNRALLQVLRAIPALATYSTSELGEILYLWSHPRQDRRIVKIAPGENARFWDECLAGGYICVGWEELGDLHAFDWDDFAAFRARFAEVFMEEYKGNQAKLTKKAREVWTLTQLAPGDIILANRGVSHVLALGEVVEPGYQWRPERADHNHTMTVRWNKLLNRDIEPRKSWAFTTVEDVPVEFYERIFQGGLPVDDVPVDPLFLRIARALERKGQVILYGPPGTGKTYHARRFATWWLRGGNQTTPEPSAPVVRGGRNVWWVVANPSQFSWDELFKKKTEPWRYGRLQRNYPLVEPGDLVIGYQATPDKRIVAIARIARGMVTDEGDAPFIELEAVSHVQNGLSYAELQADAVMHQAEPMRHRCQGTLFALTEEEADHLLSLLAERNPDLALEIVREETADPLTQITFHPSYSYEDFIEGFRPVRSGGEGLRLSLVDGLFKEVCRAALADPKHRYLVIIDEINRANIAKVLGELVTLLEMDKRGMTVTLPQSKEPFTIPPNVYAIGTMNTADRSIRLLDAAIRRRFAFIELMPDSSLLTGGNVDGLALDEFLDTLNRRVAAHVGREKQIGHAVLMDEDQPVGDTADFADRFREEILPLLQEYCYDDYGSLATFLGSDLVDEANRSLRTEILLDDDKLVQALISLVEGTSTTDTITA
jgi:5-methylcytosine-specific restriction enzyme B